MNRSLQQTFTVNTPVTVEINNEVGSVDVVSADGNEVTVQAEVRAWGATRGAAQQQEVGSVLLEADANKVYATALRIVQENPKLHIITRDDGSKKIDFTDGKREAVMIVSQLQDNIAQILVSSVTTSGKMEDPAFIVNGILRICKDMNIQCSPATN